MSLPKVAPLLLLCVVGVTRIGSGQRVADRILIDGDCRTLQVQLEHVARLGEDPEGFILGLNAGVSLDSRNRWYVFDSMQKTYARVFAFDGRFLQDFGREGQGPGEFKWASILFEFPKDTLNVYDWGNGRISRFAADFSFIDQRPVRVQPLGIALSNRGELFVNAASHAGNQQELPLHRLGPEGVPVQSFGTKALPFPQGGHFHLVRRIAPSGAGGLWAAFENRYEIQHWSASGQLTKIIERRVSWFPPHADPFTRTTASDDPPLPRVRAVREDGTGRVWSLVLVPQADWKEGFYPRTLPSGLVYERRILDEQFDTRIEVFDPGGGACLASLTAKQAINGFVEYAGDEVFLYHLLESRTSEPLIDLWRGRLVGRTPQS